MVSTVSVIIPCYNGARFLAEAIESLLAQAWPADEIIVIDDGSTDDFRAIVARYPAVRSVSQANQGVAAARDAGWRLSRGEYLIFFDQDDRLLPNAIQVGVEALDQHPDCAFVTGLCQLIDADGQPQPADFSARTAVNYLTLLHGDCIPTPAPVMFRRSALEAVDGFNLSLRQACDDYDLYLRLTQRFPAHAHNQVIADYRLHGNNQSSTAGSSRFMLTTAQIFQQQWPFVQGKPEYEAAYRAGFEHWRQLYGPYLPYEIAACLKRGKLMQAAQVLQLSLRHYPQGLAQYAQELMGKLLPSKSAIRRPDNSKVQSVPQESAE